MPADSWFMSDPHLGHRKTCTEFKMPDGVTPLRPFADEEEMNEAIIDRWNALVKPQDKAYLLGDIVIAKRFLPLLGRMNGSKRLIRGNHDVFKTTEYQLYFKEVYGVRVMTEHRLVLTHIPIHTQEVDRFGWNVHGHLHANKVWADKYVQHMTSDGYPDGAPQHFKVPDPRYINVCVEQTNFTPLHLDQVLALREGFNG